MPRTITPYRQNTASRLIAGYHSSTAASNQVHANDHLQHLFQGLEALQDNLEGGIAVFDALSSAMTNRRGVTPATESLIDQFLAERGVSISNEADFIGKVKAGVVKAIEYIKNVIRKIIDFMRNIQDHMFGIGAAAAGKPMADSMSLLFTAMTHDRFCSHHRPRQATAYPEHHRSLLEQGGFVAGR